MQMGMGAAVAAGAQTMQPSLASMAHAHQQQQQQLAAQLAASAHMSQLHAALTSQQQQAVSVQTHGHALSSSPNRGSPPLGHGMMSHMPMLPTSHGSSNSASNHAHGADASGMGHMDMAILGVFERSSRSAIATAKAQADVSMQQQLQREHGLLLAALNVLLGVARGSGKEDDAAADLSFLCVSAQRQQADADHAAPTESAKAAISALAHAVYLLVCPERSASLHAAAYRLLIAMAEADGELMSLVTGLLCSPTPTPASAGGHSGEAARELAANMVANLTQVGELLHARMLMLW